MGMTTLERMMNKIIVNDDCWIWQGATNNVGYGMIRHNEKMRLVHRVSYEIHNDTSIPNGMLIGHTCFNYRCVNPAHLYPATKQMITETMNKGKRWNTEPKRIGPFPKKTCIHCNKQIPINTFALHHGDKCKMANIV